MPVINVVVPSPAIPDEEGPCNWPIELACAPDWASFPPGVQSAAADWAVFVLWALSGRQYGPCSITIRPCGPKCLGPNGYLTFPVNSGSTSSAGMPWMIPWIDNGVWRNCGCTGGCTCQTDCEVALPGPVAFIDEVRVDGVVIDPSAYRLDGFRGIPVLVRIDGECWPDCQDMETDITEVGSFAITYQRGVLVPRAGQIAAGILANEFAKNCAGQDCALPQQLQSLSRNGIEVQVIDPAALLADGLTGIAAVDTWIRAVNPQRKAQRSKVYSSDLRGPRFNV
jgi:hypothetical protein